MAHRRAPRTHSPRLPPSAGGRRPPGWGGRTPADCRPVAAPHRRPPEVAPPLTLPRERGGGSPLRGVKVRAHKHRRSRGLTLSGSLVKLAKPSFKLRGEAAAPAFDRRKG